MIIVDCMFIFEIDYSHGILQAQINMHLLTKSPNRSAVRKHTRKAGIYATAFEISDLGVIIWRIFRISS